MLLAHAQGQNKDQKTKLNLQQTFVKIIYEKKLVKKRRVTYLMEGNKMSDAIFCVQLFL